MVNQDRLTTDSKVDLPEPGGTNNNRNRFASLNATLKVDKNLQFTRRVSSQHCEKIDLASI